MKQNKNIKIPRERNPIVKIYIYGLGKFYVQPEVIKVNTEPFNTVIVLHGKTK